MKLISSLLFCFSIATISAQGELSNYSISECLTNCSVLSEVISQKVNGNVLNLKVGAHLNCSVNSATKIDYVFYSDTLNIIIPEMQIKRDTIITKTDSSETVTVTETKESTLCRCFFHLDMMFKNCSRIPNVILINGLSLEENYKRRTILVIDK